MKASEIKQLPQVAVDEYIELIRGKDRPKNINEAANETIKFIKLIIYKEYHNE